MTIPPERLARLHRLIGESRSLLDEAIETQITDHKRTVAGICILFSGGNDSTVLAHLFSGLATHVVHANTQIGIEQTRQFVRDCAKAWKLPLLEKRPTENDSYESMVLGTCRALSGPNKGQVVWRGGFPGPGAHYLMYQRLKERQLDQVRRQLVTNPFQQRIIFLAGRRSTESGRRAARAAKNELKPIERRGSAVWVSPLLNWTKLDLNTYRMLYRDMPHNEITDLIHMSGECLCGAFAHRGELEELEMWDQTKGVAKYIRGLEKRALDSGKFPEERCQWGWGTGREEPSKVGAMCSTCDLRYEQLMLPAA